jgi:hypothetical protein
MGSYVSLGRAVGQAISRRLPTAEVWVRAQVRSCGICDGRSGTGAVFFLRVLRFPLPVLIPPTAPHSSSIIRGWYNMPIVDSVPPHPKKLKKKLWLPSQCE